MFNDRYGLTAAVLQGRKTMTRRIVPTQYVPMIEDGLQGAALIEAQRHGDAYRENEIVAVAQSYENVHDYYFDNEDDDRLLEILDYYLTPGWSNKLFVRPNIMPHFVQITDINIERLQDISEEDCKKEGILTMFTGYCYEYEDKHGFGYRGFSHIKDAFASLIDGVSGKGTWQSNPIVVAYSFKLIK